MEYIGIWATNAKDVFIDDKSVPGTLKIENKSIDLELNGSFEDLTDYGTIKEYQQIYGFTKNGHFIVLYRGHTKNSSFSAPGYCTQILTCETCFDFNNPECYKQNLKKISFEINALNNYFLNDTFKLTPSNDCKNFTFSCHDNNKHINFDIDENNFDFTRIWFANEKNKDTNNLFTCKSKLLASLREINISNSDLEEFYYNSYWISVNTICKYFILLTDRYLAVKQTSIYSETQKLGQIYDIRYRYDLDDVISPYQNLCLSFEDTEKSLNTYLKKYNKYRNIVNMYSEHTYEFKQEKVLKTKSSFINICGILEDYYRNIKKLERTEENDIFDEKLISIKSKLDDEDCLWLDNALKYNNQVSFRNILNLFFQDMDILSNNKISEILSKRKQKSLITKIYNTRNWFTHYGNKTNNLNDNALILVIDLLWIFLRYLLLNDFEVNKEKLAETIKHDSHISYLIRKIINN